jgi:predicted ABC-type ATPase
MEKPKLLIVAGPNGSGKTSVTGKILTVDRLYVYDNSVENSFPELLFRASEGILTKQYGDIHAWANVIFRAVRNS